MHGTSHGLVESMPFAETSALLSDGGKSTVFTMFVYRVGDPVDARITCNGFVRRIDKDDLIELVCSVLQILSVSGQLLGM